MKKLIENTDIERISIIRNKEGIFGRIDCEIKVGADENVAMLKYKYPYSIIESKVHKNKLQGHKVTFKVKLGK